MSLINKIQCAISGIPNDNRNVIFIFIITCCIPFDRLEAQVDTLITTDPVEILNNNTPVTDSVKNDTLTNTGNYHTDINKPKRALIYSAILPGLGQIYNRKYWKLPIVYGAMGGILYLAIDNQRYYKRLKNAYIAEIEGRDHEFIGAQPAAIRSERDRFRKYTELSYIALVGVYGLNILDAYVDAHLKTFDVSEDISLTIQPKWNPGFTGNLPGNVGLAFKFSLH